MMAEAVLARKNLTPQSPDVTAVAERVLNWTLELCAKRMSLDGPQAAAVQVRQGNAIARLHCCASIAQQVAESLGASEQNVRAVYAPDYDTLFQDLCSDEENRDPAMVRLLVWTRRRTGALDSLVTAWERALAQACREKIGSHEPAPLLDVQVIDDTDVERHLGHGRKEGMITRLAVYWMWTTNQVVDVLYDRGSV